jgi:hypothetical protein
MTGNQMLTLLSQKIEDEANTLLTTEEKVYAINHAQAKVASLVDKAYLHPLEDIKANVTLTNGEVDLADSAVNIYDEMLFRKVERVFTTTNNREYYVVDFEESVKLNNEYYEQTNTESSYAGHCYMWGSKLITKPNASSVDIYYYRKPTDYNINVVSPQVQLLTQECEMDVILHEPVVDIAASDIFFRDNKDARGRASFENAIAIINVANQRELDVIEKGTGLKT